MVNSARGSRRGHDSIAHADSAAEASVTRWPLQGSVEWPFERAVLRIGVTRLHFELLNRIERRRDVNESVQWLGLVYAVDRIIIARPR